MLVFRSALAVRFFCSLFFVWYAHCKMHFRIVVHNWWALIPSIFLGCVHAERAILFMHSSLTSCKHSSTCKARFFVSSVSIHKIYTLFFANICVSMRRLFSVIKLSNSIAHDKWAQAHNLFEQFSKTIYIPMWDYFRKLPHFQHEIDHHHFSVFIKAILSLEEMHFFLVEKNGKKHAQTHAN